MQKIDPKHDGESKNKCSDCGHSLGIYPSRGAYVVICGKCKSSGEWDGISNFVWMWKMVNKDD